MRHSEFLRGMHDAIPIGIGYLTASIGVGITCQRIGLTAPQGLLMSFLNNASAGEYAGLKVIEENGGLIALALMMVIANIRYLLMGASMSQHMDENMPIWQRLLVAFDLTDEMFALAISQPGNFAFTYYLGGMCVVIPGWSFGTVLGVLLGDMVSARLLSALAVLLYCMFITIVIPVGKRDFAVLGCIGISFVFGAFFHYVPIFDGISSGSKIIILTVVITTAAALIFPRGEKK